MSKQNGSTSRSPNIIARLMGLDVLPPHGKSKPVQIQHRPADIARGRKTYADHESPRRGLMDEQRFKDVFEVVDAEKEESSISRVNANLTEAETAFIRQKFMEAKRLSTNDKICYSKEFNQTLDSNKDLLLKFLHSPDSLHKKHFLDLQSRTPKPHCTTFKFSNSPIHVDHFKTLKVDRDLSGQSHISSQWHGNGANTRCVAYDDTIDLSKKQLKKTSVLKPTEIVVLKPNLGKPQTTGRTLPSQSPSCDKFRADGNAFGSFKANKDGSLLGGKSRDSRAIARIVSRQLKTSGGNDISRFRGYAGEESLSGSDSSSEKVVSVILRARDSLSERWKLASKSEQAKEIRKRYTLVEMLATSDREARTASFNERLSKRIQRQSELPKPIGISTRDGWKSTDRRNLSKSRKIMHEDRTSGYTIVLPMKLSTQAKGSSFDHREFSQFRFSEINRPSSSKILHLNGELSENKLPALRTQSCISAHEDSDIENGSDYEDAPPLNLSEVTLLTDPDIPGRLTEKLDHSSIPQLHPRESAKEGVSILQTSFRNEISSSSECFESLSSDLHGLRMQLQLLKRESATYNEGAMLVSSDEDVDQEESSIVTDETFITQELEEDWKSLYLADVLANSRFSDLDHKSFMATWHSSESHVDPSLFEDLEKKYSGMKTSTRLERKFLFDRINNEILEFFEQFTDLQPTKICPKWDINRIQETLLELITMKYMETRRDTKETELQWPNLEDHIEVIGKDIGEMLTDELIAELVIR